MQVLCYHDLGDRMSPGITRVRPRSFVRQIDYLWDRGWRFDTLMSCEASAPDDRTLAITFDDAYDSQLRAALPVLAERSLTATAFVVSGYVGKRAEWDYAGGGVAHADWGLLREWVDAGMAVGSHGVSHRDLRAMPAARLGVELANSRKELSDRLGVAVEAIAYPFGRCDGRVIEATRSAGYRLGVGTQPSGGLDGRLHVPRIAVSRLDTELAVAERLEATVWGGVERAKQRLVSFWAGGTPLFQRLRGDLP